MDDIYLEMLARKLCEINNPKILDALLLCISGKRSVEDIDHSRQDFSLLLSQVLTRGEPPGIK